MSNTRVKDSRKVIVGLTGRAGSSVAAFLLKKQGFSVIGVAIETNTNSDFNQPDLAPRCHLADTDLIKKFCDSIKIPLHIVDSKSRFKDQVVDTFLGKKISGLANTSCYDCTNLRLEVLLNKMIELKGDFISTGHFAKVQKNISTGILSILSNSNQSCDQSFLLSGVSNEVLEKLLLPLGEIGIEEVNKICKNFNLPTEKPQDTGKFCFDKKESYALKAKNNIPKTLIKAGEAVNIETDTNYGKHEGFFQYKVTQSDLRFDHYTAQATSAKYEVVGFQQESNKLLIGSKKYLTSKGILLNNITFDKGINKSKLLHCFIKSKSIPEYQKCIASFKNNGNLLLECEIEVYPLILGERIIIYDSSLKNAKILGSGSLSLRGELKVVDRAIEYRSKEESEQLKPIYLKF